MRRRSLLDLFVERLFLAHIEPGNGLDDVKEPDVTGLDEVTWRTVWRPGTLCVGEVVYTVVLAMNEYFDGNWTPPRWEPSAETRHCVECHGPDDMWHNQATMNHQQGHMECLMCHDDHTK